MAHARRQRAATGSVLTWALLAIVLVLTPRIVAGQANVVMPARYRLTENGQTVGHTRTFVGVGYLTTGVYCTENHRDPDGNKYIHGHLPHGYTYTHNSNSITTTKSDWAWNAYYTGYSKVSASTFIANCFTYAASTPTVTFLDGWRVFTTASSLEASGVNKSYGDAGHVILIVEQETSLGCKLIKKTREKNASSGVYEKTWSPLHETTKEVRKRR